MREALLLVSLLTAIFFSIEHTTAAVILKPFSVVFPDLPAKYGNSFLLFQFQAVWLLGECNCNICLEIYAVLLLDLSLLLLV